MATPTLLPASFTSEILTSTAMNNLRGAFRVLQVIFTTTTSTVSSATSTYVTTTLVTAVNPAATTNKVLIQGTVNLYNDNSTGETGIRLVRIVGGSPTTLFSIGQVKTGAAKVLSVPFLWLDSPATTSEVTYQLQFARTNGSGTIYAQVNNNYSMMTLQEISA